VPLSDLIPQYYVGVGGDYRRSFQPGQIYWAPTFYLPAHPEVLFEVDPDPAEARLKFEVRRAGDQSFRGSHRPLKSINLQATEELVAVKAKRRLIVLLSLPNTIYDDIRQHVGKDRKIHELSFLGLPLYGRHRGEAERGFPNIVVDRIQALMYNQFFYFPPSSTEPEPAVYESIGRLDRIQAFHADTLAAGALPLRLHPDAWEVLREWAAGYLTGEVSPDLVGLREDLIRELYT
jgi:hypothetical protein